MKPQPSYTSQRDLTNLSHRLHLGRTLESTHGAGVMSPNPKQANSRSGWTLEQLLQMSEAKSMYN